MKMHWLWAGMLLAQPAWAQMPVQDPDWPCAQRLVETLTAGTYWDGAIPDHSTWRDNEAVFSLVTDVVNRDTPEAEAMAKVSAYVATVPASSRATALPYLFGAIVDETNDQRSLLIARIKQLGLRQRRMGDVVAGISTKVDQDPGDSAHHADLVGERDFDVRAFQETQHTMKYACEAPAAMERRLGKFAAILRAKQ